MTSTNSGPKISQHRLSTLLRRIAAAMVALGLSAVLAPAADAEPAKVEAAKAAPANPRDRKPPRPLPAGMKAERDVPYVANGGAAQSLDVYYPDLAGRPLPLVVYIHGGGWEAGSKDGGGRVLGFLSHGYAVASINYRLSQQAIYPAQLYDCKAAIRFLRANAARYHVDPDRIGVAGDSAGGHLVALLGTTGGVKELEGDLKDPAGLAAGVSSRVQAVCDFYGPTDLSQISAQAGPDAKLNADSPTSPVSRLLGGPVQQKKELAATANPVAYVTPDDAPFLILHGDKDPLVPLPQSQILLDALKKAGVEAKLDVVAGGGHDGPGFHSADRVLEIQDFFDRHLKGEKK